ncbi:MAG: hypothetical protein CVT93_09120 [Bacteroidetes bacterium HGW-Bacteroidetes-10]|nr:MAG: hypothetical protein CVT93_09120 [Bacteroidetes bacterium HGW-Bacteroidetes-10]
MNNLIFASGITNSTIEFFSFVVFIAFCTSLVFQQVFIRNINHAESDGIGVITVVFGLNAFILLLRQVVNVNTTNEYLSDFSYLSLILQLLYPIIFYLSWKSEQIFKNQRYFMTGALLLSLVNIIIALVIHAEIPVSKEIIVFGGGTVITLVAVNIIFFLFKYIVFVNSVRNDIQLMKSERVNITILFTCVLTVSSAIVNLLHTGVNNLYSPALFILTVCTFIIFYKLLRTSENELPYFEHHTVNYENVPIRSNSALLEDGKSADLKLRLEKYFEKERPYLNKDLSINEVAVILYTNKTYLSKVINESMGLNFNQYLNFYRMKEVDRLINDDIDISIQELCKKSGFGCMASFTVAFRLFKGASPADWCKHKRMQLNQENMGH